LTCPRQTTYVLPVSAAAPRLPQPPRGPVTVSIAVNAPRGPTPQHAGTGGAALATRLAVLRRINGRPQPDSDDAFMFFGLAAGLVAAPTSSSCTSWQISRTLNERAFSGQYEVTAVSFHAYAYLADRYALLPHGASMARGTAPWWWRDGRGSRVELAGKPDRHPRPLTRPRWPSASGIRPFECTVIPFDRIMAAVLAGAWTRADHPRGAGHLRGPGLTRW